MLVVSFFVRQFASLSIFSRFCVDELPSTIIAGLCGKVILRSRTTLDVAAIHEPYTKYYII